MEITEYVDFIKEQFKDIAKEYGFSWRQQNAGILFLEKKNITIRFATHYREDGVTLTIYNNIKKQSYSFSKLLEKLGFESMFEVLDDNEKQINEGYKGTIKCLIYPAAILLRKHFPELLEGDFSSVGKGNPL
jgi:hypothetical protein